MNDQMLQLAEQQFIGFVHAKQGYDAASLVEDMGLKENEWIIIKIGLTIPESIMNEVDDHFKNKKP